MKRALLLLSAALMGWASAPYPVIAYGSASNSTGFGGFLGAATVFAGYDTYYSLMLRWAVDITCDHTTNTCDTNGGYTPTGNETLGLPNLGTVQGVTVTSTGLMPGAASGGTCGSGTAMCSIYGGATAYYHICNINGTQFTLNQGQTCSAPQQTFADNGTGTLSLIFDQSPLVYLSSFSGYPPGSTINYWNILPGGIIGAEYMSGPTPFFLYSGAVMGVQIHVPASASPGAYTLSFTVSTNASGGGASSTFTFPINVVRITPVATNQGPSSFPPIPGLTGSSLGGGPSWTTAQTADSCSTIGGGSCWCDPTTGITNPNPMTTFEGNVWYYDGPRSYLQIERYTNQPGWLLCSKSLADFYYNYVSTSQSAIPGYTIFPHGLVYETGITGDTRYAAAVEQFAFPPTGFPYGGGGYVKGGSWIDPTYIRETAYALNVYNVLEADAGEPRIYEDPANNYNNRYGPPPSGAVIDRAQQTTTYLLEILTEDVDGIKARQFAKQPFMDGLAMEALIKRWGITHDPRIPYVIGRELDDLYGNWYDSANHSLLYNTGADGVGCSLSATWFAGPNSSICGTPNAQTPILNDLYAHAWAWYWRLTGLAQYQTQGDDLFGHALDGAIFDGKEFNQVYRLSFDYVRWRSGR
ncbi:MAG TPA: hypothetical protein VKX39_04440 [Bryobacteraceae bacterium]|jgi:hypothetical protein|nr:hypothetical protein [Bryobacteraceae bacterium]